MSQNTHHHESQEVLEILANPEDEILAMGVDGDLEIVGVFLV
jgi:hypothetical protein